jgi:hypothetical protein
VAEHAFKGAPCDSRFEVVSKILIAVAAYGFVKNWRISEGSKSP